MICVQNYKINLVESNKCCESFEYISIVNLQLICSQQHKEMNVIVNGVTEQRQQTRMTSFHCQYYNFIKQIFSQSNTREIDALQLVIMFMCFIVYNESTAVNEKCVVVYRTGWI